MSALFEDVEDDEGLDAILARGLPAFDGAAHTARVRAACACAGCDAAGARLAAGLPPAPAFLQRCALAGTEGSALGVVLQPPARGRGALLLGGEAFAEDLRLQRELLQGQGVRLFVQCALELEGRLRPLVATGAQLLEVGLADAAAFAGAPPALAALLGGQGGGAATASELVARLTRSCGSGSGSSSVLAAIEATRAAGGHVLVSCAMGVSRSVAVALAHLVRGSDALPLAVAFHLVRRARPAALPNLGFWCQLLALAGGGAGARALPVPAAALAGLLGGGAAQTPALEAALTEYLAAAGAEQPA